MGRIDWMPIDSAPKDGTSILVYWGGADDERPFAMAVFWAGAWIGSDDECGRSLNQPTHWAEINPPGDVDLGIPIKRTSLAKKGIVGIAVIKGEE